MNGSSNGLLRRKVRIVGEGDEVPELMSLADRTAVILLGDPGMGKSTSLRELATQVSGEFLTVRAFLVKSPTTIRQGPLFLDALDEAMAVRRDVSPLDLAAARLSELEWPPFWLSCRHADWTRTDGKSLLQETLRGSLTVVQLLPLDRDDIFAAARLRGIDAQAFYRVMDQADLLPVLGNPESLRLTLEIFEDYGAPTSRRDLYEKATERLASEKNRTHVGAGSVTSTSHVRNAAGALAAGLLLSGESEVVAREKSVGHGMGSDAFEGLIETGDVEKTALTSRLFTSPEPNVWTFAHRTLAEYLAARYLADRIARGGVPLTRVLGMICDEDGKPKSSLMGLFAWLPAFLPQRAHEFVGREPYAVVTYGDTSGLPRDALRGIFDGLRRLVSVDPFFRSGGQRDPGFKAFCDAEFEPELREVLNERPIRQHLLSCVFDALEQGNGLPLLTSDLGKFVSDTSLPDETRRHGIYAFLKCASGEEAARLFRCLLADDATDPSKHLSGLLLRDLYPGVLNKEDLLDFIARFSGISDEGRYNLHMAFHLAERIPEGGEAEILDGMARLAGLRETRHPIPTPLADMRSLAGKLFARALSGKMFVPPQKAVTWLPLVNPDGVSHRERDEMKASLADRGDCYIPFLLEVSKTADSDQVARPHAAIYLLRRRFPFGEPPSDVAEQMLSLIDKDPKSTDADVLYASALHHMMQKGIVDQALFERFWLAGEQDERLLALRHSMLVASVQPAEWNRLHEERLTSRRKQIAETRERNRAALFAELSDIRSGTATRALSYLANEWFHQSWQEGDERDLGRSERMSALFSSDITVAAQEGFKAVALSAPPFQPEVVVGWSEEGEHPSVAYAILAGADLLFSEIPDVFLGLPRERLMGFLCLGFTLATQEAEARDKIESRLWLSRIVERQPEESITVLSRIVEAQLEGDSCSLSGIHDLLFNKNLSHARDRLLPTMVGAVRTSNPFYLPIIRSAAANLPSPVLYSLVLERLRDTEPSGSDEQWQWLLLAWRLFPANHEGELRGLVDRSTDRLFHLMSELGSDIDGLHPSVALPLTLRHRIVAVELAGPRFPPVPAPGGVWSPPTNHDRANFVYRHILAIGETPGENSGAALRSFFENPLLTPYRDYLKHALVKWDRRQRLQFVEMPSPERVIRSLAGGPPASSGELHGFVLDHLRDIDRKLKTARENHWIAFWNLDSYSRPVDARPENACRDAVASLLGGVLHKAGLSAEMEARHVGDTRCDLCVNGVDTAVPIEAKCDWNPELWTGWETQLRDRYACEPAARGFGIYLVFWFGERRGKGRSVSVTPYGSTPSTSAECQEALERLMAAENPKLVPIVLDVSPLKSRAEVRAASKTAGKQPHSHK